MKEIILTYSEYCKNVTARNSACYVHTDDGMRYRYNGKWYTPAEFDRKFPVKGKIVSAHKPYKGENPDSKSFA